MSSVQISNGHSLHNDLNGTLKYNGTSNGINSSSNGNNTSINGKLSQIQLNSENSQPNETTDHV